MTALRAIEFFSGIGGFAEAAQSYNINVVAAFDQNACANDVYQFNFGLRPQTRNLDSIKAREIPEAEIWWMSPPCTPFSRRGLAKDIDDPRAASFLNLIELIGSSLPDYIFVENVANFTGSRVHQKLCTTLAQTEYQFCHIQLCPTQFATPMKRPRHFTVAIRKKQSAPFVDAQHHRTAAVPASLTSRPLSSYLDNNHHPDLCLTQTTIDRYGQALNIIDVRDPDAYAICFTSNYWKCLKASGSFILTAEGGIRRFSDREILSLFGFSNQYTFPDSCAIRTRWQLLGNSVDVRSIRHLLTTSIPS